MQSDGTYKRVQPGEGQEIVNVQARLMTRPWLKKS